MTLSVTLPEPLKVFVAEARERLDRELDNNDRIKWLFLLGVFVLYVSLVLYLVDQASTAETKYLQTQARISQLESQINDESWAERALEAEALSETLRSKFWQGDTPGLAEAGFERWIRQTMEQHGVTVRQVQLTRNPLIDEQVDSGTSELSSVQKIRAKTIGSLNETGLIRFLNDAASHDSWIIIEQFVGRGGVSDRFEMDIATFYDPQQQNP